MKGGRRSAATTDRQSKQILAFLRFRGPMTAENIALDMRIVYTEISACLAKLKREGLVEDTGGKTMLGGRNCSIVRATPEKLIEKRKMQPSLFQ